MKRWIVLCLWGEVCVLILACTAPNPPPHSVLRCDLRHAHLVCTATCNEGYRFDTLEKSVTRTCDLDTSSWSPTRTIPVCTELCRSSLLEKTTKIPDGAFSASSNQESSKPFMARLPSSVKIVRRSQDLPTGVWKPAFYDVRQYIQVDLGTLHRVTGIAIRGDDVSNYVTLYRVLFSLDGQIWMPFEGGAKEIDTFFLGNVNASHTRETAFQCGHVTRYVRVNPLAWTNGIALKFDVMGCPYSPDVTPTSSSSGKECVPLNPGPDTVMNCERNTENSKLVCSAICKVGLVFSTQEPVAQRVCDLRTGVYDDTHLPDCIKHETPTQPVLNITGDCIVGDSNCTYLENGDYQYCDSCHYFCTCSEHYFFVRSCPAHLQFDSLQGLCTYKSLTCGHKRRALPLAGNE